MCGFIPAVIDWAIVPLTLFLAGVVILFVYAVTLRCRSIPPDGWATMGDITQRIAGTVAVTANIKLEDDDSILRELRPIVVKQLGVADAEVIPSARFVKDLGMA